MPTHLRMYAVPSPRLSAGFNLSNHFYPTLSNIFPLSLWCHRAGVFLPAAARSAQWLSVTGESLLRVKGTMLTSSQVKIRKYISNIYCTISSVECFLKIYKHWEWTVLCVAPKPQNNTYSSRTGVWNKGILGYLKNWRMTLCISPLEEQILFPVRQLFQYFKRLENTAYDTILLNVGV